MVGRPNHGGLCARGESTLYPRPALQPHATPTIACPPIVSYAIRGAPAKGDGQTDDTSAIERALEDHPSSNTIIYLRNGTHLVSDTLRWPTGAHGGVWMKRTIGHSGAIATCLATSTGAGTPVEPAVKNVVADVFAPADYSRTSCRGYLGTRMDLNLRNRLLTLNMDTPLRPFEQCSGGQWWLGEHIGKFLRAGTYAWRFSGNEKLKQRLDYAATKLIATQHGHPAIIKRQWTPGDTVDLAMNMPVQVRKDPDRNSDRVWARRDPQVLALDEQVKAGECLPSSWRAIIFIPSTETERANRSVFSWFRLLKLVKINRNTRPCWKRSN